MPTPLATFLQRIASPGRRQVVGFARLVLVSASLLLATSCPAQAQLFGPRDLTGPLTPHNGPGGTLPAGGANPATSVRSGEGGGVTEPSFLAAAGQMLLENRGRDSFVGSDAADLGRFVGSGGALTGTIASTLPTLVLPNRSNVNRAPPPPPADSRHRLYPPRLRLGFSSTPLPAQVELTNRRLAERLQESLGVPVQVTVVDRKATLRGQVPDAHSKTLAQLLVQFEPGVSTVENQLTVAAP